MGLLSKLVIHILFKKILLYFHLLINLYLISIIYSILKQFVGVFYSHTLCVFVMCVVFLGVFFISYTGIHVMWISLLYIYNVLEWQ